MPDDITDGAQAIPQELAAPGQAADPAADQTQGQPEGGARTYTQEEVDRTVKGRIDRQSAKHRAELERAQKAAQEAVQRAEAAEAKAAEMEAAQTRAALVSKAAAEAGVSAEVLARMAGDTEEEVSANAAILAGAIPKAAYPSVPDRGSQPASAMTKADIEGIKDPRAQLRAIRENRDLFK